MGSIAKTSVRVCRGMVFWLDPAKAYGARSTYVDRCGVATSTHIQLGSRPHLVVSSDQNNWHSSTCNVVPLTTQSKPSLNNVHVNFEIDGKKQTALVEQIKTVDVGALGDYMCTVSDKIMSEVETAIALQMGLRPAIQYVDMQLNNIVKNLERVVETIIQEKAGLLRDSKQTVAVSQVEDAALRLGITLESLFKSENNSIPDASGGEIHNSACENAPLTNRLQNNTSKPSKKSVGVFSEHQKKGGRDMLNSRLKYDGLTPIEKFNAKYGKTINDANAVEQTTLKPVRKRGSLWTDETRQAFLLDCKSLTIEQLMQKWQLGNRRSIAQTRYACEKYFKAKNSTLRAANKED